MRIFGKKARTFNGQWYRTYPWLEYSVINDAAYCFPCRMFDERCYRTDSPFTHVGLKDWKHATGKKGRLCEHERSATHMEAVVSWEQYKLNHQRGTTIGQRLDNLGKQAIKDNRHFIKTVAAILLVCAKQEIAIRGHDEREDSKNPGNFLSILKLIAAHDEIVRSKLEKGPNNAKYTSPQIQNELLEVMGDIVLEKILDEVQMAGHYSLLADETKDLSRKEQLSIVLRYVWNGNIYERFIGYTFLEQLDAKSLCSYICQMLQKCNLQLENCVCQCFDGAAVMSGRCSGVQTRFKELAPKAMYVHCCAHRLNLVIVDCMRDVPSARAFFSLLQAVYVFVSSSKVNVLFEKVQAELRPGKQQRRLKRLIETRWSCNYEAIEAIKETFGTVLATLQLVSESDCDRSVEAKGLLLQIVSYKFVVCLVMFNHLFSLTNCLSKLLQAPHLDLAAAISLIDATVQTLEENRLEDKWTIIWKEAETFASDHSIEIPSLRQPQRRQHRLPARLLDTVVTTTVGSSENIVTESEYCINIYYPVLDRMISELNRRFNDQSRYSMKGIAACSPQSKCFLDLDTLKPIIKHYELSEKDMGIELIQAQKVLKNDEVETISDVIDVISTLKAAFPELLKLLNIALTIAVSSASCERSFSSLKRTKTYLRTTMGQERLNNLSILSIEKDISAHISLEQVVDKFAIKHSNRKICLL